MPEVRPLSPNDAQAYQELRLSALKTDPQAFLTTHAVEVPKQLQFVERELAFSSLLHPFGFYGLFEDSTLIGFVQLGTTGLFKQKHIGYLYSLYLRPEHRGQGLGKMLCSSVMTLAKEAGLERLFVVGLAANPSALRFYEKLGFTESGRRHQSVLDQGQYDDEVELEKVV